MTISHQTAVSIRARGRQKRMKLEIPSTSSLADSELPLSGRPRLAVLDSGVGGLPYLDWVFRKRAGGECLYLADTEGFPYGSRTEDELISLVTMRVQALLDCFKPDLFLIACNTASVIALSALRETFDTAFVGVVPAVKPAAQQSRNRTYRAYRDPRHGGKRLHRPSYPGLRLELPGRPVRRAKISRFCRERIYRGGPGNAPCGSTAGLRFLSRRRGRQSGSRMYSLHSSDRRVPHDPGIECRTYRLRRGGGTAGAAPSFGDRH